MLQSKVTYEQNPPRAVSRKINDRKKLSQSYIEIVMASKAGPALMLILVALTATVVMGYSEHDDADIISLIEEDPSPEELVSDMVSLCADGCPRTADRGCVGGRG